MHSIRGKRIAILAADGVEFSELTKSKEILENHEALTEVISLKEGTIKSWKDKNWSEDIAVDNIVARVEAEDYDALLIPGGVFSPDILRMSEAAVHFVSQFVDTEKPIAAICHGPWVLIETNILEGRVVTSWPSLKTDLINAGAKWVDQEVVVDQGLVTSRKPADIPAFCKKFIEEIAEGPHRRAMGLESPKAERMHGTH
ncbi:MAG: type 1 glutamine amidotransferase domain-containing protein [Bdellovibrionota bacterium]